MAVKFYFQDFERDESKESFLRSEILGTVEKILQDGKFMMYVRVSNLAKAENYSCEVRLDLPTSKKIHMKKEGEGFYQIVQDLSRSLKTSVTNAL